jgi:hypothetical protein
VRARYLWGPVAVAAAVALALSRSTGATLTPQTITIKAGTLAQEPKTCNASTGALYLATDLPAGQQLQLCKDGAYYPALSLGGSGALQMKDATLDLVPGVVPFKTAANEWPGQQTFRSLKLAASTAACLDEQADLGRFKLDTSNADNTQLLVCGKYQGRLQWLKSYLVPDMATSWSAAAGVR